MKPEQNSCILYYYRLVLNKMKRKSESYTINTEYDRKTPCDIDLTSKMNYQI